MMESSLTTGKADHHTHKSWKTGILGTFVVLYFSSMLTSALSLKHTTKFSPGSRSNIVTGWFSLLHLHSRKNRTKMFLQDCTSVVYGLRHACTSQSWLYWRMPLSILIRQQLGFLPL